MDGQGPILMLPFKVGAYKEGKCEKDWEKRVRVRDT